MKAFIAKAESHGSYPEMLGNLNLKHPSPSGRPFNLGTISKAGRLNTSPATWAADRAEAGWAYNNKLATLIGGKVKEQADGESWVSTATGKRPQLSDFLPQHADAWLAAIDEYAASFASDDEVSGD